MTEEDPRRDWQAAMTRRRVGRAATVLMLLSTRANRDDAAGAIGSAKDLAHRCSVTADYAGRVLRQAVADGMLEQTERGRRLGDGTVRASVYRLVPPWLWAQPDPHGGQVETASQHALPGGPVEREGSTRTPGDLNLTSGPSQPDLSAPQPDLDPRSTCDVPTPGGPLGVVLGVAQGEPDSRATADAARESAPLLPGWSDEVCEHGEKGGATRNPLGLARCVRCRKHQKALDALGEAS